MRRIARVLWSPIGAAVAAWVVTVGVYLSHFEGSLSNDQNIWGVFGDYVGGTLNPVIGLITIVLLVHTLRQNQQALKQNEEALKDNKEELRLTREEMELTRAEHEKSARALEEQVNYYKSQGEKDDLERVLKDVYDEFSIIKGNILNVAVNKSHEITVAKLSLRIDEFAETESARFKSIAHANEGVDGERNLLAMKYHLLLIDELYTTLHKYESIANNDYLTKYYKRRIGNIVLGLSLKGYVGDIVCGFFANDIIETTTFDKR